MSAKIMNKTINKPSYGNWVSNQLIFKMLALCLVFGAAGALLIALAPAPPWSVAAYALAAFSLLLALVFLAAFVYFLIAQRYLAYGGGDVQRKILELIPPRIQWAGRGRALDIGCGSGALTVMLAKQYEGAEVTGVDYWGGSWGYYQQQCERNAALEGVGGRTKFQRASASALPFADETFDLAVSNLVFHEVRDSADKRAPIREALRVVKPGGCFVFQDLLQVKAYYGSIDDLVAELKAAGIREVHYVDTSKSPFIPGILKPPFMVGTLGMLYGIK